MLATHPTDRELGDFLLGKLGDESPVASAPGAFPAQAIVGANAGGVAVPSSVGVGAEA